MDEGIGKNDKASHVNIEINDDSAEVSYRVGRTNFRVSVSRKTMGILEDD